MVQAGGKLKFTNIKLNILDIFTIIERYYHVNKLGSVQSLSLRQNI